MYEKKFMNAHRPLFSKVKHASWININNKYNIT